VTAATAAAPAAPDPPTAIPQGTPAKGGLVLVSLILVAAVANLNLSVANVALPSIGLAFDASQTALDLVAVGYSLGLAASVLWLGALGDRYGRKLMLTLGVVLSVPACLLGAFAPTIEVLIGAILVFFMFPRKADEERLLAEYQAEDTGAADPAPAPTATPSTQPA